MEPGPAPALSAFAMLEARRDTHILCKAIRLPRAADKYACAGISPLEVINKMREMQEKLKVQFLSLLSSKLSSLLL